MTWYARSHVICVESHEACELPDNFSDPTTNTEVLVHRDPRQVIINLIFIYFSYLVLKPSLSILLSSPA
jgi:hypothetical protein